MVLTGGSQEAHERAIDQPPRKKQEAHRRPWEDRERPIFGLWRMDQDTEHTVDPRPKRRSDTGSTNGLML